MELASPPERDSRVVRVLCSMCSYRTPLARSKRIAKLYLVWHKLWRH